MKKIIHINKHIIASNRKHNKHQAPITVKTYKSNTKCHTVKVLGPSNVIYSPYKPLKCGARVWIETEAEVQCGQL